MIRIEYIAEQYRLRTAEPKPEEVSPVQSASPASGAD